MPFKTITIKEDVYKELMKAKGSESFSEFFDKVVKDKKKKPDLMKFYGAWSNMSDKDFAKVSKAMKRYRQSFNKSWEERKKRYGLG